jgi:SAM-dependent methyltransferase
LAQHGVDVIALDAAPAMVERTRTDLAALCGAEEARRRVRVGRMDDLAFADDACFDLIVALGIYHMAASEEELARALAETRRVLHAEGRVLVAIFAPGTRFGARTYTHVSGTRFVHEAPDGERACLLRAEDLDAEMARVGLRPLVPTSTVRREPGDAVRVVVNGTYARHDG